MMNRALVARGLVATRSIRVLNASPNLVLLGSRTNANPGRAIKSTAALTPDGGGFKGFSTDHPICQQPIVVGDGSAVEVKFTDKTNDGEKPTESIFHAHWLWYSDPTYIHPSSGQRLRRISQYPGWKIIKAEKIDLETALTEETSLCIFPNPAPPPGCLHSIGTVFKTKNSHNYSIDEETVDLLKVTWDTTHDETERSHSVVSYYDWNWLQRCRYDDEARRDRAQKTQITRHDALGRHPTCSPIEEVDYFDLFETEEADFDAARKDTLLALLHAIAEQGAALIRNAPLGSFLDYAPKHADDDNYTASVAKVGRALSGGALSHGALYGDLFHVRSMPNAQNIAYTSVALSPHQDLAYFESKPGMQLLHCIRNHQDAIRGGESVLMDAVAAAESLREMEPRYFQTLCRSHATFLKQREGADMVYNRPHIVLGDMGQVVAVHWSPPFEAPPLAIPTEHMEEYLEAYAAFERMLDDQVIPSPLQKSSVLPPDVEAKLHQYAKDYTWERSLEPGDMLVFNNQRMLHGRRGFELLREGEEPNDVVHRHLAGCYTNIDETINTYRMLLRDLPDRGDRIVRSFGNGSAGSL